MTPYFQSEDGRVMLYHGDVRKVLGELPDASVQCCVTSPPYWGLRDYGVKGQIGSEKTPQEFIATMVEVFGGVQRVLRKDGTLWLNLGDSYYGDSPTRKKSAEAFSAEWDLSQTASRGGKRRTASRVGGLKPKDLCLIPARVAIALQEAGWWVRSDIIWSKPNPMPESCTDRPTKAHEYIFLMSTAAKYYYDAEAIREEAQSGPSDIRKMLEARDRIGGKHKTLDDPLSKASAATRIGQKRAVGGAPLKARGHERTHEGFRDVWDQMSKAEQGACGRNRRTVWTVATVPFGGAHFATFPPKLIEPCVLAGSREGDVVLDCFNGAGTTGLVALKLGRRYIGIDLNAEYLDMTIKRLEPLLSQGTLAL